MREATPKYRGWALGSGAPKGRWSGLGGAEAEAAWQVLCDLRAKGAFPWGRFCVWWSFVLGTGVAPHCAPAEKSRYLINEAR